MDGRHGHGPGGAAGRGDQSGFHHHRGHTPPDGSRVRPNRPVVAMATRLAAVADLLAGQPAARTEVDRAAMVGLQADVISVVHAVAVTTLAALDEQTDPQARWLIRGVAARSERFAEGAGDRAGGPLRRRGGALPSDDRSLDATITAWVKATVDVLSSRHRVTQTVAATRRRGRAHPDRRSRRRSAPPRPSPGSWTRIAGSGPSRCCARCTRRGGRACPGRPSSGWAGSATSTSSRRRGRCGSRSPTTCARVDPGCRPTRWRSASTSESLMGSMRRGMHGLGNVALAHFQAIDRQVRGPGRLWMAATAVTQEAYWGYPTIEAAVRKGWIVMPPGEPAGTELLAAAKHALTTTTLGVAALDSTAATRHDLPAPCSSTGAGSSPATRSTSPASSRPSGRAEPDGARAQRRAPIRWVTTLRSARADEPPNWAWRPRPPDDPRRSALPASSYQRLHLMSP